VRVKADGGVSAIKSKQEMGRFWYYKLEGRVRSYSESELAAWDAEETKRLYVDEPGEAPSQPALEESASPIIDGMGYTTAERALKLLRQNADNPELESMITELLTMSRKDIADYILRNGADVWTRWHETAHQHVNYGMQQLYDALDEFLTLIEQAGREIEAKLAEREE
jgi:hypothetical protein